jgi:peptide/nickel transport system permease protein
LTSSDPQELHTSKRLEAPAAANWFGTDAFGRDVYARTIYGGRISLAVGIAVAIITSVIGIAMGTLSGYFRKLDSVIMRVVDGLMAIPNILLGIALVALLGASVQNVIIAVTITESPRMTRIARASVLSIREQAFVEAAVAIGAKPFRIMALHIVPNLIAPMLVMGTFVTAQAILLEAALSFLGAGTPPSIPSWGNMMAESRGTMQQAPWAILFPGFFLALTILAVNLVGDGLRDALDPRTSRVAK